MSNGSSTGSKLRILYGKSIGSSVIIGVAQGLMIKNKLA